MAPAILTCPVAAMGATGNVTDPGMSEAISGIQQRGEAWLMPEKSGNKQENCPVDQKHHLGGELRDAGEPIPSGWCLSPLEKGIPGQDVHV